MDLKSVATVIGRHRIAASIGVALAVTLAFLAAFRFDSTSFPPVERRQPTTYESTARLFITQPGFPWGRSSLQYTNRPDQPPVIEGDPDRFASLAVLYANLANTDRVQGGLAEDDRGKVGAKVVTVSQFSSEPLPMLDVVAKATTPAHARKLASTVTDSLVRFIKTNQAQSQISADERVVLELIDPPRLGKVVSSPSPALPVLVLLTILLLTVGSIFVFDNWRRGPTVHDVDETDVEERDEDDDLPRIAPAASGPTSPAPGRRAAAGDTRAKRRGIATLASRSRDE